MVVLKRVTPNTIQRRLTITRDARLTVNMSELEDGVFKNEDHDVTEYKIMADMKNAAFFHMLLRSGEAPEIWNITPIGQELPSPPPGVTDPETGRKNKPKKTFGLFVMLEGDLGERLGRLELMSKEAYVINSFVDFNNGLFNEQVSDYENMVPMIEIKDHIDNMSDWAGNPVREIIWGVYDWVDRPSKLPDETFSKVIEPRDPEEVAEKEALKAQRKAEKEQQEEKVRRLQESMGM